MRVLTGALPARLALDDDLVIGADNADVLGRLPDGAFDLIYVDPPFNTGKAQRRGALSYADVHADYLGFLRPRLERARELLAGHGTLYVDDAAVGGGELSRTWPINPARSSLYCGRDGGAPVSDEYACPFTFTGTLRRVVVTLADDQQRDPSAERRAALAED